MKSDNLWGPPRGFGEQENKAIYYSGEQENKSLKLKWTGEQR